MNALKHADLIPDSGPRRRILLALQLLLLGVGLVVELPASAIVTRHDSGYSGFLARESDYPAVFPLYVEPRRKTCVATLISPRWALTAAHCASQTPLFSHLQEHGVYVVTIAGRQFNVDQLVFHPDWSTPTSRAFDSQQIDLALIRLDTDAHVTPLALYLAQEELGQVVTFLGWGYSGIGRMGINVNDGRLRFARNQVISADQQLHFQFNDPDEPGSLAVAFEGIPGLGDSGGPALITDNGVYQLAGVAVGELESDINTESKQSTGRYGATVVYERVSRHVDWIRQVMAADQGDD